MRSREELERFVEDLHPHDVSVAVAICQVFERAGADGRVDRGEWVASVRDAYELLSLKPGGEGSVQRFAEAEALAPYLEEQVLGRLETAGIARRAPERDGWDELVVPESLWSEVRDEKGELVEDLRQRVWMLQGGQAPGEIVRDAVEEGEVPSVGSRLQGRGLTKAFRRRKVVNGVDIGVTQGEIVGLLGPNGAGKTTTFYMIVGLIEPDAGSVALDGRDLTEVPMYQRARSGVGYLAQEPSVFRKLTVEENVLAILETLDLRKKQRKERLESLLRELSIEHLRDSRAYALSGGERRRLEITRALVQRPKFLLLDEPFAGIDPIAVNDIQQIVAGLKHRGIGVIISDHNVEQTLDIVDRAYIMYEGRIRISGTVPDLVWNEDVAELYLGPTLTERMRQRYSRPDKAPA